MTSCASRVRPDTSAVRAHGHEKMQPAMAESAGGESGPPVARRVLTHAAVHGLAEQVGVTGVPAVLLDQVADHATQAGVVALPVGGMDGLVEAALGQGSLEPGAGPPDGAVPEGVELGGVSSAADSKSQSVLPSHPVSAQGDPTGSPRSLTVK